MVFAGAMPCTGGNFRITVTNCRGQFVLESKQISKCAVIAASVLRR